MQPGANPSEREVWAALTEVMDPELPVVSVVDMGIVRAVELSGDRVRVRLTPTFSACPALEVMRHAIMTRLQGLGFPEVQVETVLSPPWSSDWITDSARAKLRAFGIAPPQERAGGAGNVTFYLPVACPRCGSADTRLSSGFGPTLCKAIYVCNSCWEPFEAFKSM